MQQKVRVLVVDDSSFFRNRIKDELAKETNITVVGEAENGQVAVELNRQLSPDVITMDVAMPVMDGIQATRLITREKPTPIIMISALTQEGARATLEAMDAGAVDFLSKQGQTYHHESLVERIYAIVRSRAKPAPARVTPQTLAPRCSVNKVSIHAPGLVVIGASTGGPVAIQSILSGLAANYPYPVLVAVHMPEQFTQPYAERLNALCRVQVKQAQDGDQLLPGQVLIAPGGMQTLVETKSNMMRVRVMASNGELYRPSVDKTFSSAAKSVGKKVLAVVLTGMGNDGVNGAKELKQVGAKVWSQDEASCVVYGMPHAVAAAGLTDNILPLQKIGQALQQL